MHTFAATFEHTSFITKYRYKMKKVFLMLAVAFSMTMFSCGNKQAENAEAAEEAPAAVEEVVEAEPVGEVLDSLNQVEGEVVEAAGEVVEVPAGE